MGSVLVPGIINQVKTRLPGRWPTLAPAQLFVTKRLSPANPWSRYCCLLRLDPPPRFSFSIVIRNIRCYVRHYVIPRYIYIYRIASIRQFSNLDYRKNCWMEKLGRGWELLFFFYEKHRVNFYRWERERDSINNLFERLIIYFTIKGIFFIW